MRNGLTVRLGYGLVFLRGGGRGARGADVALHFYIPTYLVS